MSQYVKNTILDTLLSALAPHYCYGCGSVGTLLCDNCKYNITSESYDGCLGCGRLTSGGVCGGCELSVARGWCVGEREDSLKALIDGYKFGRAKASARVLAELLDEALPHLPSSVIITSIPTVSSHIRMRGYDHAALLARNFADIRGLPYQTTLHRVTRDRQRGASRSQRQAQAKKAFAPAGSLESSNIYLLIDDIATTGASLRYAAQAMKNAGAGEVWAAVVARQPL